MKSEPRERLQALVHGQIEKRLSAGEWQELNALLERDEEARRVYLDLMHDHASLYWTHIGAEASAGERDFESDAGEIVALSTSRFRFGMAAAAVVSFGILGAAWMWFFAGGSNSGTAHFATMVRTDAARWESAGQPTADGSRLGAGRFKLTEGLATLAFDSGAEVILEGPAEIELVDAMNSILIGGTVVAEIPESAWGFTIETPTANVIDHGTRFAVNVDPGSGETQTEVFEGLVEVALPDGGKSVRLETGQRNRVAGRELGGADQSQNEGTWARSAGDESVLPGQRVITTAEGNGEDGYAFSHASDHVSDEWLLLKNSSQVEWPESRGGPNRKAWLRFDVADIERKQIGDAELKLWFTPTGWGLASHLPDSVFRVYGITDDSLDEWTHEELTWENSPANDPREGDAVETERTVPLGRFTIPRGVQSGWFGIRGDQLREFLQRDENGLATLIVVRETAETEGGGLVHGVASARHPTLPAPRLILSRGR